MKYMLEERVRKSKMSNVGDGSRGVIVGGVG